MKHRKLANSELHRPEPEALSALKRHPLIVVLDQVRSLNNVGSVFRTADAFLVEHIYLCGITATPPHRDIQKTALGATVALVLELQAKGVRVWAVEQAENAIWLSQYKGHPTEPQAFVFGNEVKGVDQAVIDVCDGVIEIPQEGAKHSLNIAVSAGVVLWEAFRQHKALMGQ
jgi:23S rRNA (guanosine2251-2'-O)-methyltransferase